MHDDLTKKISLFPQNINYLGLLIAPRMFVVATQTIEAVKALQYPTTVSNLHPFLCLYSVYRRFAPSFARLVFRLNTNLKVEEVSKFNLNYAKRIAVEKHIILLILALPLLNSQYTINTDTFNTQVGFVLLQGQDDKVLNPIGYSFCLLCDANTRYDNTHKEFLEVI